MSVLAFSSIGETRAKGTTQVKVLSRIIFLYEPPEKIGKNIIQLKFYCFTFGNTDPVSSL